MPGGRYQAQGSSLFGGVGGPQPPRQTVDIPGTIDAISNGATSLIHQAMLRRQAANELELQKAHLQLQRDQMARENAKDARDAGVQSADRAFKEREFGFHQKEADRKFVTEGGILPHDETRPTLDMNPGAGSSAQIGTLQPPSPIRRAMGVPGVQVTPSNAPAGLGVGDQVNANAAPAAQPTSVRLAAPVAGERTVSVGESYNPEQAANYIRATEIARLHEIGLGTRQEHDEAFKREEQAKRLNMQKELRTYSAGVTERVARMRSDATKNNPIHAAVAGRAKDALNTQIAAGFIATVKENGGTLEDAERELQSADHADLRALGVNRSHLLAAYGKLKAPTEDKTTGQILGLVNSGAAKDVPDAAGKVKDAKTAAAGMKKPAGRLLAPGTTGAPAPGAAPGTKPPITKDEYAQLVKAGFTDVQLRAKYTVTP